ncbi:MAG: Clp protease N-terminal domain-containing protein [Planctomycetota bacterium]
MCLARDEALRFQHDCMGTEHILLALLRKPGSSTVAVLQNMNVSLEQLEPRWRRA